MNGRRLLITMAAMIAVLAAVPVATAFGRSSTGNTGKAVVLALTPVGSGFTYQGRLTDAGSPANAAYDFRFILYDAETGGAQVGTTQNANDVTVANGLFTTTLDFGAAAFDGNARWLEIAVRPGAATGSYTVLNPRQPITATPYAMYAKSAGSIALPWVATGSNSSPDALIEITQTSTGLVLQGERAVTSSTNPVIFGLNHGSGAAVQGDSDYAGAGGWGVIGRGLGAQGIGGYFKGTAASVDLDGPITVSGSNPTAFIHTVSAATIAAAPDCGSAQCTRIDNPITNGDPNAMLFVTVRQPGHGNPHTLAVNYANGYWRIVNTDGVGMPSNAVFNVLVIKQ